MGLNLTWVMLQYRSDLGGLEHAYTGFDKPEPDTCLGAEILNRLISMLGMALKGTHDHHIMEPV